MRASGDILVSVKLFLFYISEVAVPVFYHGVHFYINTIDDAPTNITVSYFFCCVFLLALKKMQIRSLIIAVFVRA